MLWEKIDRVLPRRPTAGMTARVLGNAANDIKAHLAMVFHRFLDGEAFDGKRRLSAPAQWRIRRALGSLRP